MKAMALRMWRTVRRLARDRRGVSAVEFAFIAPVMIGLYFGCVEVSDGIAADRKVTLTAAALANLTSQQPPDGQQYITLAQMNNILDASAKVMDPYSATLTSRISCLKINSATSATVKWSATRNGTILAPGSAYTFADANKDLAVSTTYPVYLLLAEVHYTYTPIIGYTITGHLDLSDQMFMAPRASVPSYNNGSHATYSCLN